MDNIGKIDTGLFETFLAGSLGVVRSEVIVGPQIGVDAGVISMGNGKLLIIAEDHIFPTIFLSYRTFGWLTTHIGGCDDPLAIPPEELFWKIYP